MIVQWDRSSNTLYGIDRRVHSRGFDCFCGGSLRQSGEGFRRMANMDWDDYLRHEASIYRQLAERTEDIFHKHELLDLAAVCEEVANSIEDRLTGG